MVRLRSGMQRLNVLWQPRTTALSFGSESHIDGEEPTADAHDDEHYFEEGLGKSFRSLFLRQMRGYCCTLVFDGPILQIVVERSNPDRLPGIHNLFSGECTLQSIHVSHPAVYD